MSDTWTGASSTNWFTSTNWSGPGTVQSVPTISATGNQPVVINGSLGNQPVIPFNQAEITVQQTVYSSGTAEYTSLSETQIGGESITLTNGANLDIQGIAMGVFYGNTADTLTPVGGTMTGLHGATTVTPNFDSHMSVIAIGNDTLTVETVNENFGLIDAGSGDTLTIYNTYGNGSNPQDFHGLINYGLISVSTGGEIILNAAGTSAGTVANFYNAGWIVVEGGTLSIASSVLDGSNTIAGAGTTDGYIEIGGGGDAILASTVAAAEEVTFTDTAANTLQITAGTLFSGTVNNFGPSDTIVVNGFTSTSNATITTGGGNTELITTNGSVLTTITLTGTVASNIITTYAGGKETITGGGNTLTSTTTYAGGTSTLSTTGTYINNDIVTVTGAGTDLVVSSSVTGTGGFFIDHGATLALTNPTGNDSTQTVIFGTHGTAAALNTFLVNDPAGFGGTVTGFGAGDDIVFGGTALPLSIAGEGVVLSYNTGTDVLTVTETNASTGSIVGTETIKVTGTSLTTASFTASEGANGLNIELAGAPSNFIFSNTHTGTHSFETGSNYVGTVAPGNSLASNVFVTIAKGTATVSTATGIVDNGLITVVSGAGFIDTHTLTGTGTLINAGTATLTGGTSLGSIVDTGSLVLGGTVASPITIAAGGYASVLGTLVDNGQLSGAGTLTVASGTTATLTGSSSLGSIIDAGSLALGGAVSGPVTVSGSGSASVIGTLVDTGSLTGAGKLTIGTGNTATLTGGTALGSIVDAGTLVDTGTITGTGTLSVSGNATLTGGITLAGGIADTGTLILGGTDAVAISLAAGAQATLGSNFADTSAITGPGTLTVNAGVTATLAAGSSVGSVLDHGTLNLAGAFGGTINMEGNSANSVVDFNTANPVVTLGNFGTTDDVILSSGALATPSASSTIGLSYSTATGVLTVSETNGNITTADNITISGTAAGVLSTSSFVALESAKGINIELAPTAATSYVFSTTGTGAIENYTNFTGGVAPGDTLSANENITIATGTASVASNGVIDNGAITVNTGTGLIDTRSLTGTGSLVVAGTASLTGNTTLGSITDTGTLILGGTDAVAISLATGAQATLASNFADTSAITGPGALTVNAGVTAMLAAGSSIGSVLDHGTLNLAGAFGGTIDMEGNSANSVVDFAGADATAGTLNTGIIDFGSTDTIILGATDFALTGSSDVLTKSYSNGTLTVTDSTSHATVAIDVGLTAGDLASFITVSGASGALEVTLCFYPGTALAAAVGEIKVEDVKAGDLLMTTNGLMPVRWVGQSHIHTGFADPLRSLPIRIRQGALGRGLPLRDLLLSPDHAIAIDGILVQASALVNGSSIIREDDLPEQFTYYHVELDRHELLLAEGVEAESFVDNVDRMHFHNWDGRVAPDTEIGEMELPRAKSARQVPQSIRRRLGLNEVAVA